MTEQSGTAGPLDARVDDEGVHLPHPVEGGLAVELDGRRVWAFVPGRDGRRTPDGGCSVAWPDLLRPHLDGRARLALRSIEHGEVLYDAPVSLGTGEGVLRVVGKDGRPLAVDKQGSITPMFAEAGDDVRRALVEHVAEALAQLDARGHRAFVAFGALLGAVRDGRLIGHDNDADIAYLARSTHPFDIIRESLQIERELNEAGWQTSRMSGGDFKVMARLPGDQVIGIDVFTAFYLDGSLHLMPSVVADLPVSALFPPSEVEVEGVRLPAPADPEAVLEATYGPSWRVPDPAFKYDPPRWARRRFGGLMRGERRHIRYWADFYATKAARVPTEPSSFARWVAAQEPRPASLVDVGSGTGRDSLWLADQGIDVLGCDYASSGVAFAEGRARDTGSSARFRRLNLYDYRQLLTVGAQLAHERPTDAVYARFLVHALEDEGRHNLWRFGRSVLRGTRGRLYLEFRTEATEHEFGEHYRQFVQPETVAGELAGYGFTVTHSENRHGLAVHHHEDPRVCRIVARLEA